MDDYRIYKSQNLDTNIDADDIEKTYNFHLHQAIEAVDNRKWFTAHMHFKHLAFLTNIVGCEVERINKAERVDVQN